MIAPVFLGLLPSLLGAAALSVVDGGGPSLTAGKPESVLLLVLLILPVPEVSVDSELREVGRDRGVGVAVSCTDMVVSLKAAMPEALGTTVVARSEAVPHPY